MTAMNRACLSLALLLLATNAFAQTEMELETLKARQAAEKAAAQQQIQSQMEVANRIKSQEALREFLSEKGTNRNIAPGATADLDAKFLEFRLAIPKFREATDDYRWALSMNVKLDKSLKSIEDQANVLLRYFSAAKMKHPRPDPQEFKDFSQTELAWETLSTSERIASFLDLAVAVERRNVVAAQTLEFLYTLNGELLRLKWLTSHTK